MPGTDGQILNKCPQRLFEVPSFIWGPAYILKQTFMLPILIGISYGNFKKRFVNHYCILVQIISLIPTEESWRNVLYVYMLLQPEHPILPLCFELYGLQAKTVTFYSCFTYVVLYFAIILVKLNY